MTWAAARRLIIANIFQGLHLDPNGQYKHVMAIPPFRCYRNGFGGIVGYVVQVGRNSFIEPEYSQNSSTVINLFFFIDFACLISANHLLTVLSLLSVSFTISDI